ncbi:UNVERIFIED_CONTAM: hypothetical protein Slati_1259200 [Sesamum latifolium]|uniref:BAH domain-containing protein n=1 Tax=Sesamum latifolium TaxID=2727402 RepID=A0AAW2XGD4_9LAMI
MEGVWYNQPAVFLGKMKGFPYNTNLVEICDHAQFVIANHEFVGIRKAAAGGGRRRHRQTFRHFRGASKPLPSHLLSVSRRPPKLGEVESQQFGVGDCR